jgi:hypothetical protein
MGVTDAVRKIIETRVLFFLCVRLLANSYAQIKGLIPLTLDLF